MNLFKNIIFAAVISCFSVFIVNRPVEFLGHAQAVVNSTLTAFSFDQWKTLAFIIGFLLTSQYQLARRVDRAYVPYGRRIVTQSLGVTSEDRGTAEHTDEANQSSVVQKMATPQKTLSLQVQAAPVIAEHVDLPTAKLDAHYSTPMYVGQYAFASASTVGSTLAFVGWQNLVNNKNIQRMFIDKRFAKFDIRFTVNVTGNPFATGIFAIANLPYPPAIPGSPYVQDNTITPEWSDLYDRIISCNHILVDVSHDDVYTIDMPWSFYTSMMSYQTYASQTDYAALAAVVISPYLPPTGSTSVISFEVYATLINCEFSETAPYVSQSLFSFGETTNIVSNLDHIENANLPINVTGDTITASVPSPVGLDNPSDPRNASESVFRMAYQKISSWKNVLDVFRQTTTPSTLMNVTPSLAKDLRIAVDEMSMDFFRGRFWSPTANATIPITTSQATGTRLLNIPIAPFQVNAFSSNYAANPATDFAMFISSFFRYWRGSMKFRIVIAGNNFKRGKLLVAVNYGGIVGSFPVTITSGSLDPRSVHHLIIDLSNKDRIIDIEVPYKAVHEYLRVPALVSTGAQYSFDEWSMGSLAVYLVSPLQVSNGTASTINFNIFQAWGKDFNLYNLQQGSDVGRCAQSKLMIKGEETQSTRAHSMEAFRNLRQILQRPAILGTFGLLPATDPTQGYDLQLIPIAPYFMSQDAAWSGVLAGYAGLRGGRRLILRFNNIQLSTNARVMYFENLIPISGTYGAATPSNWSANALSGPQNSALTQVTPVVFPQFAIPVQQYTATSILNQGAAAVGSQNTFGIDAMHDVYVDPYNQPEVILEIPDNCPMYSSQPTDMIPAGYFPGASVSYNPFLDRNCGWLAIQLTDNNQAPISGSVPPTATVTVSMMAADDTRAFWYNGGPTQITPQCNGLVVSGTTYTYTKITGK